MPRSKTFLVDANVWLALATERHEHHTAARKWFTSLREEEAAFCRITQMTLLRLLTSRAVMAEEVVKPREAWELYRKLRRDWRVTFSAEPAGLEGLWVDLMNHPNAGVSWTDAYLAAFAVGHSFTLATFDRGFRRWTQLVLLLLAA
jgi:uncharacterized protein